MEKFAIIVAGGVGLRMESTIPKQFILLKGKPVLFYAVRSFQKAYPDFKIILVLPEDHLPAGQQIAETFFNEMNIQITTGGRTRFHSVQNGLKLVSEESVVFVHDAVRCLVTPALIRRCYDTVLECGSAVPVIDTRDSVRFVSGEDSEALERERIKLVQTPQAFYSKILLPAFNIDYKDKFTDEATVVEAFGLKVCLVPGEERNIKITRPVDLQLAELLLDEGDI